MFSRRSAPILLDLMDATWGARTHVIFGVTIGFAHIFQKSNHISPHCHEAVRSLMAKVPRRQLGCNTLQCRHVRYTDQIKAEAKAGSRWCLSSCSDCISHPKTLRAGGWAGHPVVRGAEIRVSMPVDAGTGFQLGRSRYSPVLHQCPAERKLRKTQEEITKKASRQLI